MESPFREGLFEGKVVFVAGGTSGINLGIARRFADLGAKVAVLDVNIGGKPVFPFAEKLAARGVPLVLATGYGRDGLPEEWRNGTVLAKPYTFEDLAGALMRAKGIE